MTAAPSTLTNHDVTATTTTTAPENRQQKLVVILGAQLPVGPAVNAGVLLGISLGRLFPQIVGPDVTDASGTTHPGISAWNVPVLHTDQPGGLAELAERARATEEVTVVDFTETARRCRTYQDYTVRLAAQPTSSLTIVAIALCGPWSAVTSLTGHLPLYR